MDSKKYGRWGRGEGGCRIDLLVIQLYHQHDTSTVACSHLERALRSAPGTTPRATRAAVLRADGSLHRGRGGARPPRRPARAPARRRALGALRRYAASPLFSARERAALAFTEAVSRYTDRAGGMPDAVLGELRSHFSEQEVAALTLAAAGEHFFNPATGALGADARLATPGEPGVRRAAGSGMRNLW